MSDRKLEVIYIRNPEVAELRVKYEAANLSSIVGGDLCAHGRIASGGRWPALNRHPAEIGRR